MSPKQKQQKELLICKEYKKTNATKPKKSNKHKIRKQSITKQRMNAMQEKRRKEAIRRALTESLQIYKDNNTTYSS